MLRFRKLIIVFSRSLKQTNLIVSRNLITKRRHVEPPQIKPENQEIKITPGALLLMVMKVLLQSLKSIMTEIFRQFQSQHLVSDAGR